MDAELKAYLDAMQQTLSAQIAETRQHAERLNQDTRQDLMAHAERLNQDTRVLLEDTRVLLEDTRVLLEDLRHDLQAVAKGVLTVNDKLDRVTADHEDRISRMERRVP
ncbi:hypothetical protein BXT84_03125 [Sulfobacillus thermotolerans]|uniref:t-SNARE coiled-coil homology domain-containing protein n=1 Tax=Sulfobacillus thermotolerans TaxID=338644 RepID=A0ABN5GXG6_9FIRM|nr:hypothetical protein BXT84_03125 [Sulfobacillus thermotolerans]